MEHLFLKTALYLHQSANFQPLHVHVTAPSVQMPPTCSMRGRRRAPIPLPDQKIDHSFIIRVNAERDILLSSAAFKRSPVLSGLLFYLIEETIAGRAKALKSFIVAVDALGRKDNFDSASDSSARVQMGRLRKLLTTYYAAHQPGDDGCIYLTPGSYVVRMDSRAVAYPMLAPLPVDAQLPESLAGSQQSSPPKAPSVPPHQPRPYYQRAYILPIAILILIAITGAAGYFVQQKQAALSVYRSPILEITPVDPGTNAQATQQSQWITRKLVEDLGRFKLSRVRLSSDTAVNGEDDGSSHVYRLNSRIVFGKNKTSTLYLSLADAQANVLIWSRVLILPSNPVAAQSALVPAVGEINGPQGIIASYESVLTQTNDQGGYPCLLKYFEFKRYHDDVQEERVATCLDKPVAERGLQGTMLGVRAMFELERSSAFQDIDEAYKRGAPLARAGVAASPNDALTNFAMARFSYLKRDCAAARYYTQRTLALNPNNPVFSPVLAGLAPTCDYPFSEKLLDLTIQTQGPYYDKAQLLLVLAAISQNRPEKISEIYEGELPLSRDNRSNYYLTEAVISVSKGDTAAANRYWRLFEANAPDDDATPDKKLQNTILSPALRLQLLNYLQKGGVSIAQKRGDIAFTPRRFGP